MSTTQELAKRLDGMFVRFATETEDEAAIRRVATAREAAARLDELERKNAALREALQSSEAWLTGWGLHVGNCRGWRSDDACTCGLVAIRHEARAALAGSGEK
jgi:hypothetical protein